MIRLDIAGSMHEYEDGILLKFVASRFQERYDSDILLAMVDGKLQELGKPAKDGSHVSFLTARDRPGMMAYRRSALLLMLKAFYEAVGFDRVEKVSVEYAIGNGLFIEPRGDFALDAGLLEQVEAKMREYVEAEIPIVKRSVNTEDAVELFGRHRMYDKEKLFRFRRASRVNLYSIGGFEDYYYGYMAPHTGYIRYFRLLLYRHGVVLMLPDMSAPQVVPPFCPREKLFTVLHDSEDWARRLGVPTVGALNERITEGGLNDLVLIQEAIMEKRMGDIAEMIADQPDKKFVMIAGPSSSGKTTFSHRLSIQLRAKGLTPHPVSVDNYFVNRVNSPLNPDGSRNYEALECVDLELFNRDMTDLLAGRTIDLPTYNFISGEREYRGGKLALGQGDILVIEGIHCLNERLSESLPRESKFKIYISALTQLNIDEHNRIPTTDGRLLRRIIRDARTRGATAQDTIRAWPSVRRGEEENIFPYQEDADVMFNSALVYEFAILKLYAEPLLFGVPRNSEEYLEAKRLLKFLDYFLGVSSECIPDNSILREFIGGSCFDV
ncbi:MAG: nucleoside kinase [Clostridiales bacterium]|nr:nucleoside kinase [Clostridiales bacterium]